MRIGVVGCTGRMGKVAAKEILTTRGASLAGGGVRPGSSDAGKDVGGLLAGLEAVNVTATDSLARLAEISDVLIDFTTPETSLKVAAAAAEAGKAHIVGTTGFNETQMQALKNHSTLIPMLWSPNMSLGVNLLLAMVEKTAATLGEDYDIEIIEMHHKNKLDAPSGTALAFGAAAAEGRGSELKQLMTSQHTGLRKKGQIGFASLRGGDVVGEHSVIFAGSGERITFSHTASDRVIFARGAVKAALWIKGKAPGFYSMQDVLGL